MPGSFGPGPKLTSFTSDRVTADRAAFRRLFEDASRRQFDLVLFWSLDRFSREGVLETLQHLQRLTNQRRRLVQLPDTQVPS